MSSTQTEKVTVMISNICFDEPIVFSHIYRHKDLLIKSLKRLMVLIVYIPVSVSFFVFIFHLIPSSFMLHLSGVSGFTGSVS